jgi:hypothetical protein
MRSVQTSIQAVERLAKLIAELPPQTRSLAFADAERVFTKVASTLGVEADQTRHWRDARVDELRVRVRRIDAAGEARRASR